MIKVSKHELSILINIAKLAGSEIMDVYDKRSTSYEPIMLKDDLSPLTTADLRADEIIRFQLSLHFPDIFILTEESISVDPIKADSKQPFFLVDPLDGTKEFINRNGEFTVNIALIDQGIAVAGVIYAPALDELFYASKNIGVWKLYQGFTRPIKKTK